MLLSWQDFIAGWTGGVAGLLVGHPFETVKVRQQTHNISLLTTFRQTYAHEGFFGFYKGMLLPLLTTGLSNSIFFGVYGSCMRKMQIDGSWFETELSKVRVNTELPNWKWHVFLAGCAAGTVQVLCTCPVEVVKTVLQLNTAHKEWKRTRKNYCGRMLQCLDVIVREKGPAGLYRGLVPMLHRDVWSSGIYTLTYEVMVRYCVTLTNCNQYVGQILAGGTAGVLSWILVVPFDVVKSRMQGDLHENPLYKGTWDCIVKSYQEDGLRVFQKGTTAIVLRAIPVNAAIFVGYENCLVFLDRLEDYF